MNLRWALDVMRSHLRNRKREERVKAAYQRAARDLRGSDVAINAAIGDHGLEILRNAAAKKSGKDRLNVLTHCNAGWLCDGRLWARRWRRSIRRTIAACRYMSGSMRRGHGIRA